MKLFLMTTLFLGIALAPLAALAAPGIPHQFYGTVSYTDGSSISSGTVKAKIGGVVVESVVISNSKYGYTPDLFFVTDPDSNRAGATISFFVNDVETGVTAVFANEGYTNLNLSIPGSSSSGSTGSTSSGTTSGGNTTSGTTSGGSGGSATATVTTTLSAAAQKVDANKDNKIDVLDFNTLMVNWGKAESGNIADFNGDGNVDIFDFNLLMINWTK